MRSSTTEVLKVLILWTLGCEHLFEWMYALFADGWIATSDNANGASSVNDSATLDYMKKTFTAHYNGNRQPIGLYTHPIHLSVSTCVL